MDSLARLLPVPETESCDVEVVEGHVPVSVSWPRVQKRCPVECDIMPVWRRARSVRDAEEDDDYVTAFEIAAGHYGSSR